MEQQQIQEDIQFIRRMIENNRRALVDNGIIYIGTGLFVAVGTVISWTMGVNGYENLLPWFWLAAMAVFMIIIALVAKRAAKKTTTKTFAGKVFDAVWQACAVPVVGATVLFFVSDKLSMNDFFMLIASVLGIGYYVTGVINDLKFMKFFAAGWWAAALLPVMWNYIGPQYMLGLVFALFIICFEFIPGILIFNKWKKTYNE